VSEGGAGGNRTRVQQGNLNAFYMLSFASVVETSLGAKQTGRHPYPRLCSSLHHGPAATRPESRRPIVSTTGQDANGTSNLV